MNGGNAGASERVRGMEKWMEEVMDDGERGKWMDKGSVQRGESDGRTDVWRGGE